MALLGATTAVVLLGGGGVQEAEAFSFSRVPSGPAAGGRGTGRRGGGEGGEWAAAASDSSSGALRTGEPGSVVSVGTETRWIRQRPAGAGVGSRAARSLLMQLGLSRGSAAETRPVREGAAAAGAAERRGEEEEHGDEVEAEQERQRQLWEGEDASLASLMPYLAGAGGGDFRIHAESGYAPAVPSFLAAAWSSLRGGSSGEGVGVGKTEGGLQWVDPPSSWLMMDEGEEGGLMEEGAADGQEVGAEGESVLLSVPDLLHQQPPLLPSVMEPSPPPPKPDFNRNDNFTINVRVLLP